jgi:hypothetical protein
VAHAALLLMPQVPSTDIEVTFCERGLQFLGAIKADIGTTLANNFLSDPRYRCVIAMREGSFVRFWGLATTEAQVVTAFESPVREEQDDQPIDATGDGELLVWNNRHCQADTAECQEPPPDDPYFDSHEPVMLLGTKRSAKPPPLPSSPPYESREAVQAAVDLDNMEPLSAPGALVTEDELISD